eukprot:09205.XXX_445789_444961_1 [CDS] Oithona nana genome sequencing.
MMDNNPYASPKAGSPNVNRSMTPQNEAGNLKLSISLGQKGPTIIHKGPFYLVVKQDEKDFEPPEGTVTGATNLMASKNLEHSYGKLTTKKLKDTLSSFLPQLPGAIDAPGNQDNSSLRGLIEKPPVCGKELHQLTPLQLSGFRLHPGPLPEQYRYSMQVQTKKKRKHKKNHKKGSETPATDENQTSRNESEEREKRKEKKHKKHEKDAEERKKKKKEKKKKRSKEDKDL